MANRTIQGWLESQTGNQQLLNNKNHIETDQWINTSSGWMSQSNHWDQFVFITRQFLDVFFSEYQNQIVLKKNGGYYNPHMWHFLECMILCCFDKILPQTDRMIQTDGQKEPRIEGKRKEEQHKGRKWKHRDSKNSSLYHRTGTSSFIKHSRIQSQ